MNKCFQDFIQIFLHYLPYKALEIFKYNVQKYPNSANVYDSLGEGYEADDQFESALEHYQKAISRGEEISDPNLTLYKQHIERVEKKLLSK